MPPERVRSHGKATASRPKAAATRGASGSIRIRTTCCRSTCGSRSRSSCRCPTGYFGIEPAIRVEQSEMTLRFSRVDFQQPDESAHAAGIDRDSYTCFRGVPSLRIQPDSSANYRRFLTKSEIRTTGVLAPIIPGSWLAPCFNLRRMLQVYRKLTRRHRHLDRWSPLIGAACRHRPVGASVDPHPIGHAQRQRVIALLTDQLESEVTIESLEGRVFPRVSRQRQGRCHPSQGANGRSSAHHHRRVRDSRVARAT